MLKHILIILFLHCATVVMAQALYLPEYVVTAQKTHISVEWAYWCGGSDISYFVVERSKDGKKADSLAKFELVCLTSGELTPYTFADSMPEGGLSYYRIKAYSFLYNLYYYEAWQKVVFLAKDHIFFQANPNPVENQIRLVWYKPAAGKVKIELYDCKGSQVRTLVNEEIIPGTSVLDIEENIANLPQGLYYLRAEIGENTFQTKLVTK